MAGGQFTAYNKVLPGVYINYKSKPSTNVVMGERGTVAIARQTNWGKPGEIITIEGVDNLQNQIGYDQTAPEALFIRELMRGSNLTSGATKILFWRLEETGGQQASVTLTNLTAKAKYAGTRGNSLSVVVAPVLSTESEARGSYFQWQVDVVLDGLIVESHIRGTYTGVDATGKEAKVEDFKDIESDWIIIDGTGEMDQAVATALTGGTNGTLAPTAHSNFITALGKLSFNIVVYDGDDTTTKSAYKSLVNRLCTEEGRYCVAVMADYAADSEYVINVGNGFTNEEGVALDKYKATWWVGGASAGANYWESLTYHNVNMAHTPNPEYENSELEKRLAAGEFLFFNLDGDLKVLSDVSSFTSVNVNKSRAFCKNRVVRTIMQICNDLYLGYSQQYIGVVDVNEAGVNLVKAYGVEYLNQVQAKNGIKNFEPDHYVVEEFEVDSMKIHMEIQPVDSLERIYIEMTIA